MNSHPLQHIGAALVSTSFLSFLSDWSPVITWGAGVLAIGWYGVLFYDRFLKNTWPKNKGPLD